MDLRNGKRLLLLVSATGLYHWLVSGLMWILQLLKPQWRGDALRTLSWSSIGLRVWGEGFPRALRAGCSSHPPTEHSFTWARIPQQFFTLERVSNQGCVPGRVEYLDMPSDLTADSSFLSYLSSELGTYIEWDDVTSSSRTVWNDACNSCVIIWFDGKDSTKQQLRFKDYRYHLARRCKKGTSSWSKFNKCNMLIKIVIKGP